MQRCAICIEEDCNGKKTCHCDTCSRIKECNKILHPVIRITKKCTQACSHCCFSCSPKCEEMITIKTASQIKQFLNSNNITIATIMGGEFFCNPEWKQIFEILIPGLLYVRLVTNGDWTKDPLVPKFLKKFENIKVSISKDQWHTNKNVDKAIQMCKEYNLNYNIASANETSEESIVPVGRSMDSFNFFGMFGCWCHSPDHMYSFLIDEQGLIYKCGFGIWNYTKIEDHLEGGFSKVFKKFNRRFHSSFISNCRRCSQAYTNNL